jgi:hypothetical protein
VGILGPVEKDEEERCGGEPADEVVQELSEVLSIQWRSSMTRTSGPFWLSRIKRSRKASKIRSCFCLGTSLR